MMVPEVDMGKRGPAPSQEIRERALKLRLEGLSFKAIADQLGMSRQRAQQLLSPPPRVRDRVVIEAQGRCTGCDLFVGSSGHIHHRQAKGLDQDDYNDYPNLMLLCPSCHRRAHQPDQPEGTARPVRTPATGADIRAFRARFGLNQAEFAQHFGVTQAAVSRWEARDHHLANGVVIALALEHLEAELRRPVPPPAPGREAKE